MILRQLIERVTVPYDKGMASDDSRLSSQYVYTKLLTSRNRLIAQQANRNQKINQWVYQTLPCVELIVAPVYECPCIPPVGCTIYRTKKKLPKPLNNFSHHLLQSVTTIDGETVFDEIGWEEKRLKQHNRFTKNKPDYFIKNDYLYITQKTGPTILTIIGAFADPVDAFKFPSKCDDCQDCHDCYSPLDMDFPIDAHQIDTLIEMARTEILHDFSTNREDRSNNSADSTEQESK
jgi:hypothetical protein